MNSKKNKTAFMRHQFFGSLSLAALLLLVGGAANTFAAVNCVASTDADCSAHFTTIQAAVTASAPGDIVLVGPGTYNEQVTINQNDLSLFGAQAGNDARKGRGDDKKESIVNSASGAFVVNADRVILDGFTIQGANNHAAIFGGGNGLKLFNNIVQENSGMNGMGLFTQGKSNLMVRRNLFRNETYGVFAATTTNAIVSDNVFNGNNSTSFNATAINFNSNCSNITVTNNQGDDNQTYIVIGPSTSNVEFSHNQGSHFSGSAVYVTGTNDQLVISDNDLDQGAFRGIKFNQDFGAGTISHATVSYNTIRHMGTFGIFVQNPGDTGSGVPTLSSSVIVGNTVSDSGIDGIFVAAGNSGNLLTQNTSRGNKGFDCHDTSAGSGTSGTGNTWFNNLGKTSSPLGLCSSK